MVRVRVPASSANMGPGFDALGIAVNVYNEYIFEEIESGLEFEGIPEEFCNEDNVIYVGFKKCIDYLGITIKGLKVTVIKQDIPISRGLGSSSSCIVAGIIGAYALANVEIDKEIMLKLAVEIEGHPDNVAPAIYGNMVSSIMEEENPICNVIDVTDKVKFVCFIPDFRLSTKEAREVIPREISLKCGVYNVSRAALLVSALMNGNTDLLKYACNDGFHQNYRKKLINHYEEVREKSFEIGALGFFLSGAGPTLMAMVDSENEGFALAMREFFVSNSINWQVLELEIDKVGAVII